MICPRKGYIHLDSQEIQFLNLIFMEPCIVVWLVAMTNKMQLS